MRISFCILITFRAQPHLSCILLSEGVVFVSKWEARGAWSSSDRKFCYFRKRITLTNFWLYSFVARRGKFRRNGKRKMFPSFSRGLITRVWSLKLRIVSLSSGLSLCLCISFIVSLQQPRLLPQAEMRTWMRSLDHFFCCLLLAAILGMLIVHAEPESMARSTRPKAVVNSEELKRYADLVNDFYYLTTKPR